MCQSLRNFATKFNKNRYANGEIKILGHKTGRPLLILVVR